MNAVNYLPRRDRTKILIKFYAICLCCTNFFCVKMIAMKGEGIVKKATAYLCCVTMALLYLLLSGCTTWKDRVALSDVKQKSLYSQDITGTATNLTGATINRVSVNIKFTTLDGTSYIKSATVQSLQPNTPKSFVCTVDGCERYWEYEIESVTFG